MSDADGEPRLRVMVVDDHPMWRDAVERDLQDAGFDVVAVAADGHQAIARFRAARPQVVVLDLQIPGPSGVEVTADVLGHDPSARVLILSASGEQDDVLQAVKAGATGYLVKSASRAELIEAVRRVASIAFVHETLSHTNDEQVELDTVMDRVAAAAAEVAAPETRVVMRRAGSFGTLPAEVATPLVMVLNELLLNAVEHGFAGGGEGEVRIEARRERRRLRVSVADTGPMMLNRANARILPNSDGTFAMRMPRTLTSAAASNVPSGPAYAMPWPPTAWPTA